ncbi:hypothetical protein ALQ61_05730 [Pseudomonas coronafaciens pv. zizaniae]|nr:hypothetical protein ALQ61_05730 [Pseudomonas coronafaciens pv. zizaniae]
MAQRRQGVCCFARLRDRNEQGVRLDHDLAVTEFAGHFYLARDACQAFKPVTRDHAGVVAGAARDNLNITYLGKQLGCLWTKGVNQNLLLTQTTFEGALHNLGLFVDFLEHEVAIFALVGSFGAFMVLHHFTFDRQAVDVPDLHAVTTDLGDIALFQVHEAVGYLTQRQLVGSKEVFTQAHTDHQGAATAGGQQTIWLSSTDNGQTVGTVKLFNGSLQCDCQVRRVLELVVQQVNNDFSVGIGDECITQGLELFAQGFVVLDDAVVDNCQLVSREMRVSIALARRTVGGPAGVSNAQTPRQWLACQRLIQFTDLTGTTTALQGAFVGENSHACAVITSVLETFEAFEQDGGDVTFSDGADYSTHGFLLADSGTNQCNAAGLYLFARLEGQAIICDKGMDAAPGQLQVGDLATDLVGFDHDHNFPGDFSHDPTQAQQLVEGRGAARQIDAVGTDEQLIKVVGPQHLFGDLSLKGFGMRVPCSASHQQHRLVFQISEGTRDMQGISHDDQTRLSTQFRNQCGSGTAAVDDDSGVFTNSCDRSTSDSLFIPGYRLAAFTDQFLRKRHCTAVAAKQKTVGFECSEILSNRNFGSFKTSGQIIDTHLALLIEQGKYVVTALWCIALRHDSLKFRFER